MQQKQVNIKGKKLSYRQSGEGLNIVVLVHGFGEDSQVWENQVDALQDYHLIIPDLPGSGESEMIEDMSMEGLAEALRQLIVHETATVFYKEGEPGSVVMIGHSMGGYVTLAFAEKFPAMLKAFGLLHSTAYADSEEKKEIRRKGIAFIEKNGAFEFLKTATPNLYSPQTKADRPALIESQVAASNNFSGAALVSYYESMIRRPDRTSVLKTTKVPVLFILGKYDNAVPFQDGLQQCYLPPLSYIHVLENSGHMGMQEEPNETTEMVINFLENLQFHTP
jgi:pimeloyl-ACP methyl ester carboxylesterase